MGKNKKKVLSGGWYVSVSEFYEYGHSATIYTVVDGVVYDSYAPINDYPDDLWPLRLVQR